MPEALSTSQPSGDAQEVGALKKKGLKKQIWQYIYMVSAFKNTIKIDFRFQSRKLYPVGAKISTTHFIIKRNKKTH